MPDKGNESLCIGKTSETNLESSKKDEYSENNFTTNGTLSSMKSWTSSNYQDGLNEISDENKIMKMFMKSFVDEIFHNSNSVSLEEKSRFGSYCQTEKGRIYFARFINEQRTYSKQVSETTFYSLVQYFAIVLFECAESEHFSPAKTLMNMCFTFYHVHHNHHQYLYHYLKDQPIWKSIRFWSAAFFDSILAERTKCPIFREPFIRKRTQSEVEEEKKFQENATFGQLGAFAYYMKEFGLSKKFCIEFIRKQMIIANLPKEQVAILQQNIDSLYN